jgi:hypothetical protein
VRDLTTHTCLPGATPSGASQAQLGPHLVSDHHGCGFGGWRISWGAGVVCAAAQYGAVAAVRVTAGPR